MRTTPSYNFINFDRGQNVNSDILDRWTPENTDGRLPSLITSEKRADEYYWYDQKRTLCFGVFISKCPTQYLCVKSNLYSDIW